MEASAQAAPAVPVSKADAGQICSRNDHISDAINAAWPGDEALAQLRRAVAGLLLRSQRKSLRPHAMTNTDLGGEVRARHQHLVAELLPDGGKLKFSKLLLRQPNEPGAGTAPEFFAMESVGGAPGVRLKVKQLLCWWEGGQDQSCTTSAGYYDSTAAGDGQDAQTPRTSLPASATQQDAIAVLLTAAGAPVQAVADATLGAVNLEPMGVATEPHASLADTPSPQPSRDNAHAAGGPVQGRGSSSAGSPGTVSPVQGPLGASATEEQLAAAAAWPGEGPKAQLRRAAAALLLRTVRGPHGPHSLQQAALRKELCQHHPDLVEVLVPKGGKLRLQDVLPRQRAIPEDRDPTPHPDPRVTQGQGHGASADEESWEQLYAEASSGSGGSEAAAPGAEAREGLGAGQEAGGAEDACRLLPEFFVRSNTAKGEPVVRLDRAAMLRWWRQRAGVHGSSGGASNSGDVSAAAAMGPQAPAQGLARASVRQELEATAAQLRPSVEMGPCTAGASCQPGSAAFDQPEGWDADDDGQVFDSMSQERGDAGVGGGGDNDAAVACDAAAGCGSRPEGGHLSTAAATGAVTDVMEADAPPGGDAPGPSPSAPAMDSVDCDHCSGGASDGGNSTGSAAGNGDGSGQLGGSDGAATPIAAATVDIPCGTSLPASGAAGPASPLAPHLPSISTLPGRPHTELHLRPQGPSGPSEPTGASDHGTSPPATVQPVGNALPAVPTETVPQLKKAALKIGAHAPDDAFVGAVAAALPGKDPLAMMRRRCALLLQARGSGESQGPFGTHSMTAAALASALFSSFPGLCLKHVSGADDDGLRLAKMLRDTHRTAAGQRPGGADAADTWRRHEAAPGGAHITHPAVPKAFSVRLDPPERAAVRLNLDTLMTWWSKVRPVVTSAGASAAGPDASTASPAMVDNGSCTSSPAPGQSAGGRGPAGSRPQAAGNIVHCAPSGSASSERWRPGADGTHAAQPPSRIVTTLSPLSASASPIPHGALRSAAHAPSLPASAAVDSRTETTGEGGLGASTALGTGDADLYLGPQRPGHARASLTAIPGGEVAGGGGGSGGGGTGGEEGKRSVRAGGTGAGRSGGQSAGEDPWHLEQRRRKVEADWEVVCRARGYEALRMPPGLAAACASAWSGDGYVSRLRWAAAVLLMVPPPRVEGGGIVDRQAEELGPFTLREDSMHCELAQFFPGLASKLAGSGGERPLRYFLNDKSAGGDAKLGQLTQGRRQQQQQPSAEQEDGADRAAIEQDPAHPPCLFTVLETHTGKLALRLHLMALQLWWHTRNHTHTADLGHGTGLPLAPTGQNTSPLSPPNPAASGLWVEALRGQRGHLAPSLRAGPPCADTPLDGVGGAGVAGGRRAAVRWHRSATRFARGIVGRGFGFQGDEGGGVGADLVDARLCISEVQLHRGLQRRGRDNADAAAIAAAWRGGGATAQLGRRLAAMLMQPPAAAQGPAGPFSMSKATLCAELRAMYPELVAELLLSPPQSTTLSQQSPSPSLAPTPDHAGGLGSNDGFPLEWHLWPPARSVLGGDRHAVPGEAAHPPLFTFEEGGEGQVAVRLEVEALKRRGDGDPPAPREHKPQLLTHGGGGGGSSGIVGPPGSVGVGAPSGSVNGNDNVAVEGSGTEAPRTAPRPRSALLLDPVDVGGRPWPVGAAASDPAFPTERPTHPLTDAPASAAAHAQLMVQAPVLHGTAAPASPSPLAPDVTADAGADTSTNTADTSTHAPPAFTAAGSTSATPAAARAAGAVADTPATPAGAAAAQPHPHQQPQLAAPAAPVREAGSGAPGRNGEADAVANGRVPGQESQGHGHQRAASNPMVVPVSVPVPSADAPHHGPHHVCSSPPQAVRPVYAPLQQQPRAHMLDEGRGTAAAGSVQCTVQEHHKGQEPQGPEPEQGRGQELQAAASHSFDRYLEQLFPFPPDAATLPPDPHPRLLPDGKLQPVTQPDSDAQLEVEAKRAVAQLLAEAPPPHHQLPSRILGAQLQKLLGGRKCPGGGLRRLCMSAPHVFMVLPQEGTSGICFTVRLTHPELLAWTAEMQGGRARKEQQQDAPAHGGGRQEHARGQQQERSGSAAAAAGHVEQLLASLPVVIPIPIPGPSADAPHHTSTTTSSSTSSTSSTSSSPPPAAPAPLQQQPQRHLSPRYEPLCQHPTHHTHHPYLQQLLLPPHLVQSLSEPSTVFVHWTGARHVTGSPAQPSPSSASAATSAQAHTPASALGPAHSSWRDALSQLLMHSRAATQVGVAVLRVRSAASLVAVYVPPAAAPAASALIDGAATAGQGAEAGAGAAAAEVSGVSRALGATVYVVDLAVPHPDSEEAAAAEAEAAAKVGAGQGQVDGRAGGGPAAYTYAVVEALRAVLEDGRVAKVVHGAQQIDALEVTCGQQLRSKPILDTRQVLEAMLLGPFFPDLPPPPPPPTPSAPHAHPLLPTARMAEALRAARLRAHVEGVRRALGGTGLWDDRPQLLELLSARQLAALGDEHDAAAGRDRVWAERPLSPDRVLSAAQRAAHLPELWTALAHEALPWASMHAAAQAAERRRMEREVAAAAAAEPVAAGDASGTGL